mmetsp:Transcript_43427/g.94349  ORF Transcript_43427/g.94349 Transcript_43427/m.94349 type:complete len:214 (-) Transcript_43427:1566-2207(-)
MRRRIRGPAAKGPLRARLRIWEPRVASGASRFGVRTLVRSCRILAAVFHVNLRAARVLNGYSSSHLIEVSIGDQRIVRLEGLHILHRLVQTVVGSHANLRAEAYGAIGTAPFTEGCLGLVVGARIVPGESDQDGIAVHLVNELPQVILERLQLRHMVQALSLGLSTDPIQHTAQRCLVAVRSCSRITQMRHQLLVALQLTRFGQVLDVVVREG